MTRTTLALEWMTLLRIAITYIIIYYNVRPEVALYLVIFFFFFIIRRANKKRKMSGTATTRNNRNRRKTEHDFELFREPCRSLLPQKDFACSYRRFRAGAGIPTTYTRRAIFERVWEFGAHVNRFIVTGNNSLYTTTV